jgi:ribonuclease BN (tRNA processing enzyme)
MSGLRLLSLGVGDAFSALYYSSCFALEAEGQWLLIDSPHPIRKILREGTRAAGLTLDVDQIGGLVLTHLHGDHASGVEGLAFYFYYVLGRRLRLITHPNVAESLWTKHLAGSMEWSVQEIDRPPAHRMVDDFLDIALLEENQTVLQGPFRLSCRKAIHNIPTIALKIEAAGRTLGYSADTAYDPSLIEWLGGADLIVHEACGGFMHTPYEALLALPEELRAKMLILHYPDTFDTKASAIEPMQQGRIYRV